MEEQEKGQSKLGKGIKEAIGQDMKDAGAVISHIANKAKRKVGMRKIR